MLLHDINNIILIFTFTVDIALAVYLAVKDRKSATNLSFSAVIICLAIWAISYVFWSLSESPFWIKFWIDMTFFAPAILPAFFLYFFLVFPKKELLPFDRQTIFMFLPALFFSAISFTPLIASSISAPYVEPPHGGAFNYFATYFICYILYSFYIILNKYVRSNGREKVQMQYLMLGTFIAAVIGTFSNIYLVTRGLVSFGPIMINTIGPASTLIMAGFITYAIGKLKLLDIDDFLAKGLIYGIFLSILIGTLMIVYSRNIEFLFTFYIIASNVSLGIYVLFQNRGSSTNRSFFALTSFIGLWILCDHLTDSSVNYAQALFWSKSVFIGAAFMPSTFLYYAFSFLGRIKYFNLIKRIFLFIPSVVFLVALPLDLIVSDVQFLSWGVNFIYGPLIPLFIFYFISYLIFAFYVLASGYGLAHGIKKAQIGYLFLGTSIAGCIGLITNFILPSLGMTEFYRLGPPATIVMMGFISYSIVKHRLMNIEFVIQKGFIYSAITILIMAIYGIMVFLSQQFLSGIFGQGSLLIPLAAAIIIAVTYQPVIETLQEITDKIFFRARYDYQRTIRDISKALASIMSTQQLARYIVEILASTIKIEEISFLLYLRERERYKSVATEYKDPRSKYRKMEIDPSSHVVSYLAATKMILVSDELDYEIEDKRSAGADAAEIKYLEELRDELERLGLAVWAPVISKNELICIIALGYKLSGDMYTAEDLSLISTLSNQAAIALDNARLYEEILATKNYTENVLQSITSGVVTTDLAGTIITHNRTFERMTGLPTMDITGNKIDKALERSNDILIAIKNVISGQEPKNIDRFITNTDHINVPVSLSSVVLKDGLDKKSGFLFIISDLSEVKNLEEKVKQADKLAALGTMAQGMAHEIKNPLSSMKVFSQLLHERFEDPEFRKKFEEIIPKEINRIDRIVEGLLSFARSPEPQRSQFNIASMLEDVLNDFREDIERSGIKLSMKFRQVSEIVADKGQIARAFSNLILNAIQAMPGGGELSIELDVINEPLKMIIVKINDTGQGISREHLNHMFDPFFTTKHYGTGLGLAITHSILSSHNGTIEIKSQLGKGTQVNVTLPVT